MNLDTSKFLEVLLRIGRDKENWESWVEPKGPLDGRIHLNGCIHLKRKGSEMLFSPLTSVLYELTGEPIHRGSFWCEELQRLGLPWWDILEIAYANIKCGTNYNKVLRNEILMALGLPPENISKL